jgi:hypothetical protein
MTPPNKVEANRKNAKLSTGPRTTAGKLRTRANGAVHGLHAALVVVEAAGETVVEWEQFRGAVVRDLATVGPVETELAGRIAEQFWRLRRPARYEAAVAAAAAANLPPHPDGVTGAGVDPFVPLQESATPAQRLAVLRALLIVNRCALDVRRRAVELIGVLQELPNNEVVDWGAAEQITRAAGDVLGWRACESWGRWKMILTPLGAEPQPEWTAGLLAKALAAAAQSAGKSVEALSNGVSNKLAADSENLVALITTREGEEHELVGRMLSERARAAAAAVYADERAAATVAKVERHLGRELERTLHLLHGLQAARLGRDEHVGEVLGGMLELSAQRDGVVAALAEARGSGPTLSSVLTAETAGTDDVVLVGTVGDGSFPAEKVAAILTSRTADKLPPTPGSRADGAREYFPGVCHLEQTRTSPWQKV